MGSKALAARAARFVCAVPALLAAACAGTTIEPEPIAPKGLACVDDSRQCVEQRMTVLKGLMSDRDKRWVREPATPEAYASGVRLFAFKGRKKDLNCDELAIGKREADAGPAVLRGASSRLTPAQISRGAMLSGEVGKELGVEMRRRCKA